MGTGRRDAEVTLMPPQTLQHLLGQYLTVMRGLHDHGLVSVSNFAEILFALALRGTPTPHGTSGYDIVAPRYGRVQVKCRKLPSDGRTEERLLLGNLRDGCCDYLGAVIFGTDLAPKKATLVRFNLVWELMERHPDPQRKVRFGMLAVLPGAVDLTEQLRHVLDNSNQVT
jgi:hypothetical protein